MSVNQGYYELTGVHQDSPHRKVNIRRNDFWTAVRAFNLAGECGYESLILDHVNGDGSRTPIASW